MPFHPLGIAVLGTLAVVGTGVAFKKLVYDPHLAPYVEAYVAQFQSSPSAHAHAEREAIAMPVHTHRASLHTQDGWSQAHRQLNEQSSGNHEEEAVARATGRDLHTYGYSASGPGYRGQMEEEGQGTGLRNRRKSYRASMADEDGDRRRYGEQQTLLGEAEKERYPHESRDEGSYPLNRSRHVQAERKSSLGLSTSSAVPLYARRASTRNSNRTDQLIDLGAEHDDQDVTSPQDAEIRQVIFNYPASASATPSMSGRSTPALALSRKVSHEHLSALGGMATLRPAGAYAPQVPSQLVVPDHDNDDDDNNHNREAQSDLSSQGEYACPQPSTTFSFLSLSGASSPAVPTSVLGGSWHAASGGASPSGLHYSIRDHELQLQFPSMGATRDVLNERADAASDNEEQGLARSVPDLRHVRAHLGPGAAAHPRAMSEDGRMDDYDMLSLPDTTASSYADADGYTPNESRAHSPSYPSSPPVPSTIVGSARSVSRAGALTPDSADAGAGELGLTFVRSPRAVPLSLAALQLAEKAHAQAPSQIQTGQGYGGSSVQGVRSTFGRGPLSVVSLSDSEAERSDWEAV